uniref:IS4 family transposase n=1 Tax=Taenia asiatica TaxID=60517 RepID=A0A0R3WCH6_TAEAS
LQLEEVAAVFAKEGQLRHRRGAPSLQLLRRAQFFCFTQRTLLESRSDQFLF